MIVLTDNMNRNSRAIVSTSDAIAISILRQKSFEQRVESSELAAFRKALETT